MLRLVAVRLSMFADVDGGSVRPGTELVGVGVGISERQAWRYVRQLQDLGLIDRTVRGGGRGRRTANEYRLTVATDFETRLTAWLAARDELLATRRCQEIDA